MRRGPAFAFLAAALLCATLLACWWPGVALYDSVQQYREALTGAYDDWHPPIMARLWALLRLAWDGQAPMFVLQALLYWLGLGLIAAGLAATGARWRAGAVLLLGALPLFSGWAAIVLKDEQMFAALVAAIGLIAWWRLRERQLPWWAIALTGLLFVYATLVRTNALFATLPLGFVLAGWFGLRRLWLRGLALAGATAAVLLVSPFISHQLLGAAESGVQRTLPTYDLAGIAHYAGPEAVPLADPDDWAEMEARHCYTAFFWDPLGDARRCDFIADQLDDAAPDGALFQAWIETAAAHPLAYAQHRLGHWNATTRWLVPFNLPEAAPPDRSEPNALGLVSPGPAAVLWAGAAGWIAATPLGWPILWFAAALAALPLTRGRPLPFALALSAVGLEASFLFVSIASDLRYHLWAMLAAGLAWLLIGPVQRRSLIAAGALVGVLALAGLGARLVLPPAGGTYAAMLAGG